MKKFLIFMFSFSLPYLVFAADLLDGGTDEWLNASVEQRLDAAKAALMIHTPGTKTYPVEKLVDCLNYRFHKDAQSGRFPGAVRQSIEACLMFP
ncbi:MAG: hypothetical protein A2600_11765 [Candidatus Lambdaproteobacteria bacterium RIFOXYD1_FULL_56_27]|uniref:Rap1a immunity protein domain-containing protein n=1 Tax=Candidatus Lambdaproteobacteria bacterium RIFOXYD2_FULL_56_26 TaxID=1817773 RepID=A0A1F6GXH8_9PROT|nr:MAG: hypothetical protein A2426_12100 [Candidatus Lambdaproteobacteria bacterium RIFOXYC1_FULL_56_13]OGH02779.1 MAG: hypothetical protein A2557_02885 [Candidatus Lambdaproteobacteria bacterium RIFOXYD2_FULL_56_26]OGH08021.1 MAG: hypothetical protein A2600_11765 [Candidatus Lambdaproteobacteria bacterium RIFOXYD1_FULL_56_27]